MFFSDNEVGLIQPYWSNEVVQEAIKNIMGRNRAEDLRKVSSRFAKMNLAFPYAEVSGYQHMPLFENVHQDDQHVAQAAVHVDCDFLLTENTKHFKNGNFQGHKLKIVSPDSLLTAFYRKNPMESSKAIVLAWWHKLDAGTFDNYLSFLEATTGGLGLSNLVKDIRANLTKSGEGPEEFAENLKSSLSRRY